MVVSATASAYLEATLSSKGIARAPFNQRDEGADVLTSNDPIDFPIADSAFSIDDGRALVNADPEFNLSPSIGLVIAFLAFLLVVPQMLIQRTAGRLIGPDVLVDAFRTQLKPVGGLQAASNLFQTLLCSRPYFGAEPLQSA